MTLDPHLDDETLSARHDGALSDGDASAARSHVDACATCRGRLEAFAQVSTMVAAPIVAPSVDTRAAAIDAALTASSPPRRRERNWAPALAVAAVVLLLAIAVPLMRLMDDSDDPGQTAAGPSDTSSLESAAGAGGAPGALTDLGVVDAQNLSTVVGERVGEPAATFSQPAPAAPEESADRAAGSDDGVAASGGAAGDTLTVDQARACEPDLEATGDVVLVARATWDGRPAAVLAYRTGDDVTAYVVDPPGCRILHFVRFRAPS